MAETGWVCVANPLVGWGRGLLWKVGVLLRHIALIFRCLEKNSSPHILVREFSTVPLLLIFPFIWPLRKKLYFTVHHNLQWAARSWIERVALIVLTRLGARWAIFETQDMNGLSVFNIPAERNLVIPLPCCGGGAISPFIKNNERVSSRDRVRIGVVGYYRPEKGMDPLLYALADHFPDCELILGVPNLKNLKAIPNAFRVVDTSSKMAYQQILQQCDVLVQNGEPENYFYRVSGLISDAATCGTAVVAPDLPLIAHQLSSPVPVGEVFQRLEEMPGRVRQTIEKVCHCRYDFKVYCAARSASALATCLDAFSRGQNG